jgi:Tol biopolymer transport system component
MGRVRPLVVVASVLGVSLLMVPAGSRSALAVTGCSQRGASGPIATASPNGRSSDPAVSGTGRYIAFDSVATNLLDDPFSPDSNGFSDVFVQDREEQTMQLVSVGSSGVQGDAGSYLPDISEDGRYVVYGSAASNLVAGDTNGAGDVFRHDTATLRTVRVSLAGDGSQANGESGMSGPKASADATRVAFASAASNLVPGDTNGASDVFVRDVDAGTTRLVSVDSSGGPANDTSYMGAISADGNVVAFSSAATDLIVADQNGRQDVFVRNLSTGTTTLVSVSTTGVPGNSDSLSPAVSSDGRYVAFVSYASNLVLGDDNGTYDVFVRDMRAGTTTLVSVAQDGSPGNGGSAAPSISSNGRFVAFASWATDLFTDPLPPGGVSEIYERDTGNGTMSRLSVSSNDVWGNRSSWSPDISADGLFVGYQSTATNLVDSGIGAYGDVFTHQWVNNRQRCETEDRADPLPLPFPVAPLGPPGGKPPADPDCQDFTQSAPLGADPLPDITERQFYDPHVTSGSIDSFRPGIAPEGNDIVYLRNGWTRYLPDAQNEYGTKGNWGGFGFRHVAAKHGWGPDVAGQVALVLGTDPNPQISKGGTRWGYRLRFVGPSGRLCARLVWVAYLRTGSEIAKGYPPAHIITTYAWKV